MLAYQTRPSSTNALLPAVYQTLPRSALLQQESAASANHSTPVPGRIKGQNIPRAPSLAKPQRLQLVVPQKSSPSHSKLKCSQPCQFHTRCLCLQSPCSGCRSPVQSEAALDHPVGLHPLQPAAPTRVPLRQTLRAVLQSATPSTPRPLVPSSPLFPQSYSRFHVFHWR